MASVFREVVVDCTDPARVAAFWHDVLGWPVVDADGFFWLSATGEPTSPPLLVFVPVPEAKTVKNRVHLDVNPSGCDQAEELERLLALGARPRRRRPGGAAVGGARGPRGQRVLPAGPPSRHVIA